MLPEKIKHFVLNESYELDDIGMSHSTIRIYENKVLKIQDNTDEAKNELYMLKFLQKKLPVPEVYAYEESNDKLYILMSKCPGQMLCSDFYMENPDKLIKSLANGLKKLWSIDISQCSSDQRLDQKLIQAEYNIKNDYFDINNVDPSTFGPNGFKDPSHLLQWLNENRQEEELVLSHGDFCLPNIFGIGEEVTGFIDIGKCGIADKWCDIALCYRSLCDNFIGQHRQKNKNFEFDKNLLFDELGLKPNWDKIRYYILLDELF